MRILYLGFNDRGRISFRGKISLREKLKEYAKVICYGPRGLKWGFKWGHGKDVVRLTKRYEPDIILFQGLYNYKIHINWKRIKEVKVPKALFILDPHKGFKNKIYYNHPKWANSNKIDMTFWGVHQIMESRRKYYFKGHKMRWMPWSVDVDVYKDYGLKREYDVGVLGAPYPARIKMRNKVKADKDIKLFYKHKDISFVDMKYAKGIANCKIFLFNSPTSRCRGLGHFNIRYPLQKYFEGMACNTLVMSHKPADAERLHFIPNHNFIQIDNSNFISKSRYYLEHEDKRLRIAKNGFDTIRKYHTSTIRAKQLYDYLKELI